MVAGVYNGFGFVLARFRQLASCHAALYIAHQKINNWVVLSRRYWGPLTRPLAHQLTHSPTHSLTHSLARSLAHCRAGPIGMELSQAMSRLGTKVWTQRHLTHSLTHSPTHPLTRPSLLGRFPPHLPALEPPPRTRCLPRCPCACVRARVCVYVCGMLSARNLVIPMVLC